MTKEPAAAVPAATILLLRDGAPGLEVFMVVRHHQIDFASGALVFPGGKVYQSDTDPRLRAHCRGAEGLDDATLALRVAAIREAYEECGVLLAYPRSANALLPGARLKALHAYREKLEKKTAFLIDLLLAEDLDLACDRLVPFAHWITPPMVPKRFDTHFFLVVAPADQLAAHDGRESVDSIWITPRQVLADADANKATVIFPTRMNVQKLGRATNVADALAAAKAERIVTVQPEVGQTPAGRVLRIPIEAGYGVSEVLVEGMPRA
jgi:8-oxo-dGTP pyrophosphatase MutT (NUDIX family)